MIPGLIGLFGFPVCLIGLVISAIRRKRVKTWAIGLLVCFILLIAGSAASVNTDDGGSDSSQPEIVLQSDEPAQSQDISDRTSEKDSSSGNATSTGVGLMRLLITVVCVILVLAIVRYVKMYWVFPTRSTGEVKWPSTSAEIVEVPEPVQINDTKSDEINEAPEPVQIDNTKPIREAETIEKPEPIPVDGTEPMREIEIDEAPEPVPVGDTKPIREVEIIENRSKAKRRAKRVAEKPIANLNFSVSSGLSYEEEQWLDVEIERLKNCRVWLQSAKDDNLRKGIDDPAVDKMISDIEESLQNLDIRQTNMLSQINAERERLYAAIAEQGPKMSDNLSNAEKNRICNILMSIQAELLMLDDMEDEIIRK